LDENDKVIVELVENYKFRVTFPDSEKTVLYMDEPPPLGEAKGPNAAKVLAASVANCLSASLLFCLRKIKIDVRGMRTEATPVIERNEQGYWRVKKLDVTIVPEFGENVEKEKIKRCLEIFENYCIVTGAVRDGIEVNVTINSKSAVKL
jgi:uncharacterized OsmC-like protein